jgi:hypothetical protein
MRDTFLGFVVVVCAALAISASGDARAQNEEPVQEDSEYARVLKENPDDAGHLDEVDGFLSGDEELDESYVAYEDSLEANAGLQEHENALFEAVDEDTAMARLLAGFEEEAAEHPESAEQMALMDSLLAADPGLAERMQEVEAAAAEDPDLVESYGGQMSYLYSRPMEAEEFFTTDEGGPYYPGSDEEIVAFVYYVEKRPRLFRAYWSLFTYIRADRALRTALYRHWRWYGSRRPLWKAHWRYRVWTARKSEVHRMVWARRVYLGKRPWLGRSIWKHHFVVAKRPLARPVLWKHSVLVAKHPKYRGAVAKHRHWVRKHSPPPGVKAAKAKPFKGAAKVKTKPKVKTPAKAKSPKKTKPPAKKKPEKKKGR